MRPLLLLALLSPVVLAAQVPSKLGYQGRLLKADGTPVSGAQAVTFTLYDAPTGGAPLWGETQVLGLVDGYYATFLGDASDGGVPSSLFSGPERYLELTVGGSVLSPRQRVDSVAYAMTAANLAGGTANASSLSINGVLVIDSTGHLTGSAAALSGVSGTAPVQVASSASTAVVSVLVGMDAGTVAAGNDPRFGDARSLSGQPLAGSAPATSQVLTWTGTSWAPASSAAGTVTSVTASAPLSVTNGSTTPALSLATGSTAGTVAVGNDPRFGDALALRGNPLAATSPGAGQALVWSGSAWVPTTPTSGTVTSVTGSGPLVVTNGTTTPGLSMAAATGTVDGYLAATDFATFAAKLGPASTAGGDVTGTFSALAISKLLGVPLSPASPADGQVLTFNAGAGEWRPTTPVTNARNYLINGGMDFFQRGTPTSVAHNAFLADRWLFTDSASGATGTFSPNILDASLAADVGNGLTSQAMRTSAWAPAAGTWRYTTQWLEPADARMLRGKAATFSVFAKCDTATSALVGVYFGTGTGRVTTDLLASAANEAHAVIACGTTWQRFSVTATVSASATQVGVFFGGKSGVTAANSNTQYELAQAVLNEGTQPAAFTRAGGSLGGELALAQRYYQKSYLLSEAPGGAVTFPAFGPHLGTYNGVVALQSFYNATYNARADLTVALRPTMRAAPAITLYNPYNGDPNKLMQTGGGGSVAVGVSLKSESSFWVSGVVTSNPYSLPPQGDDEFWFHWTADAEL